MVRILCIHGTGTNKDILKAQTGEYLAVTLADAHSKHSPLQVFPARPYNSAK